MKYLSFLKWPLLVILSFALFTCGGEQPAEETASDQAEMHDHSQENESADTGEKKPLSPKMSAMANVGNAHVHIDYSAPSMRGRMIWGGLVPYGQVWVTGAHQATAVHFSKDVRVGEVTVPAGKYALFTIPGEEEWTILLNENYEQHLTDEYDESLDMVRVKISPEQLEESVERLTYEVESLGEGKGQIAIMWEKVRLELPFEVVGG